MARRIVAMLGLGLALALLLPVPASKSQSFRNWNRRVPGVGVVVPPPLLAQSAPLVRRGTPQLPSYYFDRGGPIAVPKGPVGPGGVASSLQARGFRDIGPMQQRGSTSITQAIGPAGERVQLVIGPNGEIVGVRVLSPGAR